MKFNKVQELIRDRSFVSGFLLAGILIVILKFAPADPRYLKVLFILLLFAALYLIRFKKYYSLAFGILTVTSLIIVLYSLNQSFKEIRYIHQWDFFAFYLYGKLGLSGSDFYNPDFIAGIFSSLKPAFEISSEFYASVINVGFPYPPVSMILFAPLGFFNLETANILWRLLVLIFQIIDIILLIKLFKKKLSPEIGILAIIGLALLFPGALSTQFFSQTNYFLLFFILLTYKNLDNWKSGLFLAISVFIKPLAVIWCLYLIVNRKWSSLISLICSGILLVLITGILFGFDNYISYINSPPTNRIPPFQYVESINQSLLATLSRFIANFGFDSSRSGITLFALFSSLLLTILTSLASYRIAKSNTKLSFLIFIPLSLLVYPGFLVHYSIFLIPVFFEILYTKNYPVFQRFFAISLFLFFLSFIFSYNSCFIFSLITLISLIIYSMFTPISPGFKGSTI